MVPVCNAFSHLWPIRFGCFWLFFLRRSAAFCLLISSLHQPGSFLLLLLPPSRFLLTFLECFACHKNSFQLWVPVIALCLAHCLSSCRLLDAFFAHVESLVYLFLGRAFCLSRHFRDLANQYPSRPIEHLPVTRG